MGNVEICETRGVAGDDGSVGAVVVNGKFNPKAFRSFDRVEQCDEGGVRGRGEFSRRLSPSQSSVGGNKDGDLTDVKSIGCERVRVKYLQSDC